MQSTLVRVALCLLFAFAAACGGGGEEPASAEPGEDGASSSGGESESGGEADAQDSGYLAVGSEAPDFSAPDQTGVTQTLSSRLGRVVVLYFYPRDATPGCTREACAFRDAWDSYVEANVEVLGVSVDSVESHLAFAEEHELPFALIADVDASIASAYRVTGEHEGATIARRITYVIAADGTIAHVFEDVDPGVHATEVLETIAAL